MVKLSRVLLLIGLCLLLFNWPVSRLTSLTVKQRSAKEVKANLKDYFYNPKLLNAIIWTESDWRSHLRGSKGERGLMQVTARQWKDYSKQVYDKVQPWSKAWDPEMNVRVGCAELKWITEYLKKKEAYGISNLCYCYNWGSGNWYQYIRGKKQLPRRVKAYARRVLRIYRSENPDQVGRND